MLLQDLFRVSTNDTRVTIITDDTVFSPRYNGLLSDTPIALLDVHIKSLSAIDMNHILITVA